jgi:hypothetical protein
MAKDKVVHYKFRDLKIFGSTEWLANNEIGRASGRERVSELV